MFLSEQGRTGQLEFKLAQIIILSLYIKKKKKAEAEINFIR